MRLYPLNETELGIVLKRAIHDDILLSQRNLTLNKDVEKLILESCGGDARKMLNTLELAVSLHSGEKTKLVKNNIEEALQKKIAIVGPSTLYYCLKVVEHMWAVDQQTKNAKSIADQGSQIYDQTVRVYESFSIVLESFKKLTDKLEEAKKRLQYGRGSLLGRVSKLKEMGRLSTKKKLPENTFDKDEV